MPTEYVFGDDMVPSSGGGMRCRYIYPIRLGRRELVKGKLLIHVDTNISISDPRCRLMYMDTDWFGFNLSGRRVRQPCAIWRGGELKLYLADFGDERYSDNIVLRNFNYSDYEIDLSIRRHLDGGEILRLKKHRVGTFVDNAEHALEYYVDYFKPEFP